MKAAQAIACTLGARDLKRRHERWRHLLATAGTGRTETEHGLRLAFDTEPGVEDELRALASAESECCAWAEWHVTRDGDAIYLDVRSTGAGVTTLHAMF
jgi:hypothetical protein